MPNCLVYVEIACVILLAVFQLFWRVCVAGAVQNAVWLCMHIWTPVMYGRCAGAGVGGCVICPHSCICTYWQIGRHPSTHSSCARYSSQQIYLTMYKQSSQSKKTQWPVWAMVPVKARPQVTEASNTRPHTNARALSFGFSTWRDQILWRSILRTCSQEWRGPKVFTRQLAYYERNIWQEIIFSRNYLDSIFNVTF